MLAYSKNCLFSNRPLPKVFELFFRVGLKIIRFWVAHISGKFSKEGLEISSTLHFTRFEGLKIVWLNPNWDFFVFLSTDDLIFLAERFSSFGSWRHQTKLTLNFSPNLFSGSFKISGLVLEYLTTDRLDFVRFLEIREMCFDWRVFLVMRAHHKLKLL